MTSAAPTASSAPRRATPCARCRSSSACRRTPIRPSSCWTGCARATSIASAWPVLSMQTGVDAMPIDVTALLVRAWSPWVYPARDLVWKRRRDRIENDGRVAGIWSRKWSEGAFGAALEGRNADGRQSRSGLEPVVSACSSSSSSRPCGSRSTIPSSRSSRAFPFFYWFQMALVLVSAAVTAFVYFMTESSRSRIRTHARGTRQLDRARRLHRPVRLHHLARLCRRPLAPRRPRPAA